MTPKGMTDVGRQRIKAMVSTTDGFKLAEVDLQLRAPARWQARDSPAYRSFAMPICSPTRIY